jgi:hypothetical protein
MMEAYENLEKELEEMLKNIRMVRRYESWLLELALYSDSSQFTQLKLKEVLASITHDEFYVEGSFLTDELYLLVKGYCAKKVETLSGMIDKREEEI